jgi:hypothetical protein
MLAYHCAIASLLQGLASCYKSSGFGGISLVICCWEWLTIKIEVARFWEVSMVDVETLAKAMQDDNEWLSTHFDELVDAYAGKVVAIQGRRVVGVGDRWEEVQRLFPMTEDKVMPLIIDVPHPGEWNNLFI